MQTAGHSRLAQEWEYGGRRPSNAASSPAPKELRLRRYIYEPPSWCV